jgi:aryl-alcohol dehydrogenase-like predicted oxidoreductase
MTTELFQEDVPSTKRSPHAIARRTLGRTGVDVSMLGLGGAHVGTQRDERESIRIVRGAIDRGVTFLDNGWDYNEGRSESRMGKALLDGYRDAVFLMTKIDGRTKAAARGQIEQSLRRLRTDRIDLVQVHEVIREDDPARCFAKGGCIEALVEARRAGKIRFIGFTGHKDPELHLAMLRAADARGFAFDTVQMPLNVMDAHFRSFERKVLPVLRAREIGVLAMKPLGGGHILASKTANAVECLHYAMSLPVSVVITGCDSMAVLDQAVEAARTYRPLTERARAALLARTADAARSGRYEKFKTTDLFDATSRHREWLERAAM